MKQLKPYTVYLARFPFIEKRSYKLRPVVALSSPRGVYKVLAAAPVYSRLDDEGISVTIEDWQGAGLLRPSVAKIHRMTAILEEDLVAELGCLSLRDRVVVREALKEFLDFD